MLFCPQHLLGYSQPPASPAPGYLTPSSGFHRYLHIHVHNIHTQIKDIFINGTLYHLWYFPALILGLWITYFFMKKLGKQKTFLVTIILYLVGLFGDSYYGITEMSGIVTNIYNGIFYIFDYTRNGVFLVPLFLFLGYMVKTNKESKKYDSYLSLLFFICMTFEAIILQHFNLQRHDSMYLFLIPLMFFLFRYLIHFLLNLNFHVV